MSCSNLVVLFFNGQGRGLLPVQFLEPPEQLLLAFPQRHERSSSVISRRAPGAGRFRPARPPAFAVDAESRERRRTQSAADALGASGVAARSSKARSPSLRRSPSSSGSMSGGMSTRLAAKPQDRSREQTLEVLRLQLRDRRQALDRPMHQAPKAAPARPAAPVTAGTIAMAGATVCPLAAAFRISSRTTDSVIRALCASRSANWSRSAASGMVAATASIFVQKLLPIVRRGQDRDPPPPGRAGNPGTAATPSIAPRTPGRPTCG